MATYKVTYFPVRARAEGLRLTLSAAGQPFEDERITQDEWPKLKPNAPMKALPMLTVTENGKTKSYCQSGACCKYVARKHDLMGSTPEEALLIDEVYESTQDIFRDLHDTFFEKDEEKKKELMAKFTSETIPKIAEYFNLRKTAYGQNGYIIGPKLTLADIVVYTFVEAISLVGHASWFEKYPELTKHEALVKSNEGIAKWLAKRPDSKF